MSKIEKALEVAKQIAREHKEKGRKRPALRFGPERHAFNGRVEYEGSIGQAGRDQAYELYLKTWKEE